MRVCPERDAVCPWGIDCPYTANRYECHAGWRNPPRAPEVEALKQLQKDAGLCNPPTPFTYDFRMAVSGVGPRAFDWSDKPHRFVYDLCTYIENLEAAPPPPVVEGGDPDPCPRDFTAIEHYDDGSSIHLSSYAGGAAPGGEWSTVQLFKREADGSETTRDYVATGPWRPWDVQPTLTTPPPPVVEGGAIAEAFRKGAMAALGCEPWDDADDFYTLVGLDYAQGKPLPSTMPPPQTLTTPPRIGREEIERIIEERVCPAILSRLGLEGEG